MVSLCHSLVAQQLVQWWNCSSHICLPCHVADKDKLKATIGQVQLQQQKGKICVTLLPLAAQMLAALQQPYLEKFPECALLLRMTIASNN